MPIHMAGFDYKKAVQTLNFFAIKEGGHINKMKALKLIWLSDRLHLRMYARPIVHDQYWALRLGPIQSNTKDLAEKEDFLSVEERNYRDQYLVPDEDRLQIQSIRPLEIKEFAKTDLESLEQIYTEFGNKDEWKLSDLSHEYPEWLKFKDELTTGKGSRFAMDYLDFFENPQSLQNDFFANIDVSSSKAIYCESMELKK